MTGWLRVNGLSVTDVNPRTATAHGTAAQMATTFGTQLENYRIGTATYHAQTTTVTAPAAVAPDILTVNGLDNLPAKAGKPGTAKDVATAGATKASAPKAVATKAVPAKPGTTATPPANPCPAYLGQTPATDLPAAYGRPVQWAPCGYTPQAVRDAYGVTGTGLNGKGVTVGIIGVSYETKAMADADRFSAEHGEPQFAPGQFTAYVPDNAGTSPSGGEFTMDIEAAHAMAPAADIAYVVAPGNHDGHPVLDAMTRIVDEHLADVVSGSVLLGKGLPGLTAGSIAPYEQAFQQAAVEGITVNFASGDSGSESYDGALHVAYPAASPWVTAVGGTTLATGPGNQYAWETGWATDAATLSDDGTQWTPAPPGDPSGASGGGNSSGFTQPGYQRGIVPPVMAGSTPARTVPDVAALADPSLGLLYGHTAVDIKGNLAYTTENGGGTSLSSPLFAGVEALIVQAHHGPIGFANPALYARYRAGDFRPILDNPASTPDTKSFATVEQAVVGGGTWVQLTTPGQYADSDLTFGPGYNLVTGLGSPTRGLIDSFRF
ncbi:S8 family serine peptidase [Amycolatopsis sp. NBC_00345]|uniref:S53 family peptidase n=1 Tax=Amycolatopsis sp. NBC_00345 TaxID=2975955 RepID=UPI002E269DE7